LGLNGVVKLGYIGISLNYDLAFNYRASNWRQLKVKSIITNSWSCFRLSIITAAAAN